MSTKLVRHTIWLEIFVD